MSKNIGGLPYGVHYRIDSHNGYNGSEHCRHVHIYGNGCDVKFSIDTAECIEGHLGGSVREKDLAAWVRENQRALIEEWDDADDAQGGR